MRIMQPAYGSITENAWGWISKKVEWTHKTITTDLAGAGGLRADVYCSYVLALPHAS